jgi:hypothetical protein
MAAPCLRLRGERKIIELQMSRCGAALARIKVSASRGERKIIELQMSRCGAALVRIKEKKLQKWRTGMGAGFGKRR